MAVVTKKIKNLRTQYKRERQKTRKTKTGTGTDDVYVSKWQYLDRLRFLEDHLTVKQTTSNLKVSTCISH